MNIEDNLHQRIAAYRYKSKKVKQSGRISELKKKKTKLIIKRFKMIFVQAMTGHH